MKVHIRRYANEKNNVITASDMKKALESHGGVRGCKAAVVAVDTNMYNERVTQTYWYDFEPDHDQTANDPSWSLDAQKVELEDLMDIDKPNEQPLENIEMLSPQENDQEYVEFEDDEENKDQIVKTRLELEAKDIREEPKAIVFLSKLLLLFQFCHYCFWPKPCVNINQSGTSISIKATCEKCKQTFSWDSQPMLLGRFPAGNLLLSFAAICAGASIKKLLLVFQHMNVLVYHEASYYYHQRHLLIPTIVTFWREYKEKIIHSLSGKEVVLAGDGRHDSMGHSAKFCTYSILCCTIGLIIDIVLVQIHKFYHGHRNRQERKEKQPDQ
ncbi:hypothetical protein QZH41_009897, partial [Actinostola sp. cb2023]